MSSRTFTRRLVDKMIWAINGCELYAVLIYSEKHFKIINIPISTQENSEQGSNFMWHCWCGGVFREIQLPTKKVFFFREMCGVCESVTIFR